VPWAKPLISMRIVEEAVNANENNAAMIT